MNEATIIAVTSALCVMAGAYAAYVYLFDVVATRRELRARMSPTQAAAVEGDPQDILRARTLSTIPSLNALLQRLSLTAHLETMLLQAGLGMTVSNVLYLQAALAMGTFLVLQTQAITTLPLAIAIAAAVGGALPLLYLRRRRTRRFKVFSDQFPGALDMIRSSIQAGHSLNYALEVAVDELPDPIALELRTVLEEIRLGLSAREALDNLTRRVPISELRFFAIAVILTRQVGGNLSEVLGTLAGALRERAMLRQKVRALSSQGRASAGMLIALPYIMWAGMTIMNPSYMTPMLTTSIGHKCIGIAVGLQLFGLMIVRKICNPKELQVA
jgi:tight adherence protein B